MPKVPEVPGAIIENGKIPRIAYVTPVIDRTKMTKAWTRIEKAITNILKTVKEMEGPEIPMQEIDDNTKDGITYYSTAYTASGVPHASGVPVQVRGQPLGDARQGQL